MDPMGNESLAKHGISGREFRSWRCFIVILQITSYLHETIHISPLERKTKGETSHQPFLYGNYTNLTGKNKQKLWDVLYVFLFTPFWGKWSTLTIICFNHQLDLTAQLQLVMPARSFRALEKRGQWKWEMLEKRKDCYFRFPCVCVCKC